MVKVGFSAANIALTEGAANYRGCKNNRKEDTDIWRTHVFSETEYNDKHFYFSFSESIAHYWTLLSTTLQNWSASD